MKEEDLFMQLGDDVENNCQNNIKISIIVPIYNSEQYLEECIVSLVNQTLQEIEIILINDASTDSSNSIMQQYRNQYPEKIKCIYLKENIHQGGARNRGIEIAQGEFIMFVDSDDEVDCSICEKLYKKAIERSCDIVFCDILKLYEGKNKQLWFSYMFEQQKGDMTYEKKKMFFFTEGYPFAKIISRKLIIENQIRFPEKMKYEDFAVVIIFYLFAEKTDYVAEPLYFYNIRENSTSKKKNSVEHYEYIKATKYLFDYLIRLGLNRQFEEEIEAIYTYGILHSIKKILTQFDDPNIDMVYSLYLNLLDKYPEYKVNKYLYFQSEPIGILALEYAEDSKEELHLAFQQGKLQEKYANYAPYYNLHKDRIEKLFRDCHEKEMKIAIWGAGKKGSDFLEAYDSECKNISYVIDKDSAKVGMYTSTGHLIQTFESIPNDVDVIISMNRFYHSGIKAEVKSINKKICVVNLDVLLLAEKKFSNMYYELI